MNGKRVLTIVLILQILAIGGIIIYAFSIYWSNRPSDMQQDAPSITNQISAKIVSISDSDGLKYETFSVSELALDYLSANSKIVVMGADGIKHYNGSSANTAHCRLFIYLQSEFNATGSARYVMSCTAIDPVVKNLPDLPFGNSDITIETEIRKDDLYHPKAEDVTAGITLDMDTYEALIQVLQYYAGDGSHDDYLEDPLQGEIDHSFTITEPHFTLL